jgi:hypothetical protein
MLRITRILIVLFAVAGDASGEEPSDQRVVEHWKCYSIHDHSKEKILVEALRFEGLGERRPRPSMSPGLIKVAGVTYVAVFYVDGFDRRWNFGPTEELDADKAQPFSLVMHPDGSAAYYDWSGVGEGESVKPQQLYECAEN